MRLGALLIVASVVGACVTPASTSPTPTANSSPTVAPSLTASPVPTAVRGSALVPPIVSRAQYGDMGITLDIPDRPGQPAEGVVWRVELFKPPTGYTTRVASALGLTGPGVVGEMPAGAAPGSNGPWRLWFGERILAMNETSGEVYYFDPSATDGPPPPGPARRDPTEVLRLLLGSFGWSADVEAAPDGPTRFRGTEVTARADPVITGSWLEPGYREAAVLFPRYEDPVRQSGPHTYGTDHFGLVSAKGRPAELIHRPLGALTSRETYPITAFGQARSELLAAPLRYLHFLSNPTGEPLNLRFGEAYLGSTFAGFSGSGLTHSGQLLLPVWVFTASGTTASGVPVDALFIVDAVVPELRAQGLGGTGNTNADMLLRYQLETLAGQNKDLLTPLGAVRFFLNPACEPKLTSQQADVVTGAVDCGGPILSFTMRRAFPNLASSIWFVAETHK